MRILLLANMAYAFALPVINIFTGAYVMHKSSDVTLVVTFQLACYLGIPPAFFLNGLLLSRVGIRPMYSVGMLATSLAMAALMWLGKLDCWGVAIVGAAMGAAMGLCWANRGYLAMAATNNENRNYYFGLEASFATITAVTVPFLAGWLLAGVRTRGWLGGQPDRAYHLLTGAVFLLTLVASVILQRGQFTNPPRSHFVYFRYHGLWNRLQLLAALKGLGQGYIVTAPAMLIMHVANAREGVLGLAQALGGIVSALVLYAVGRRTRPQHRVVILGAGLALFALGATLNAALFDALGVWLFMLCLLTASPLLDVAYFPIQFRVIDTVAAIEHRNRFAYIFAHEFGLLAGRLAGCGLFLIMANCVSRDFALRYALLMVAGIELYSITVARHIRSGCEAESLGSKAVLYAHTAALGKSDA